MTKREQWMMVVAMVTIALGFGMFAALEAKEPSVMGLDPQCVTGAVHCVKLVH